MRVVIVEDENRAVKRLSQLLCEVSANVEIIANLQTVRDAVSYDWDRNTIDLIFLDIHLADGSSFEIFKEITLEIPIIFVTAYDQYALEAFQVNSIDYLLKPVQKEKLKEAVQKYHKRVGQNQQSDQLEKLLKTFGSKPTVYAKNLLVQSHQKLMPVPVEKFAYFFIENGLVKGKTFDQKLYILDQNLDDLETTLDPNKFYRANRQIVLRDDCIIEIESYFNSRLLVSTNPLPPYDVLISKAKAREFKEWIKG